MNAALLKRAPRKGPQRQWAPTVTGWAESTYAEQAYHASRSATVRWAVWGAVVGLVVAVVAFAPAAWLARAVASATEQRVLLADARGSVWSGSAVLVLTAGEGSRDARSLPGRLAWSIGWRGLVGLQLALQHDCCLHRTVALHVEPGFGRSKVSLASPPGEIGHWPAALLGGLGTPWNTLQLAGTIRLSSPGFSFESAQGRGRLDGQLALDFEHVASRIATLETLGSYRLILSGDPASPGTTRIALETLDGALQLSGSGSFGAGGLRFRGEARAASPAEQPALENLLNIIGRRSGERSIISIG